MIIRTSIAGREYAADMGMPIHIAIPVAFNGEQPNTYDLPPATAAAFEGDGFVGDVRRGGGCNFETYSMTPHCNGTHTECVGHITAARISVHEQLKDVLVAATVITVEPVPAADTSDSYAPSLDSGDRVIDRSMLSAALEDALPGFHTALVIRTTPNSTEKRSRRYMADLPAFFTLEAMELIAGRGTEHLLTDLPSVDRTFDDGKLSTHHIFWQMAQGSHEVSEDTHMYKTITEMIYVPDDIPDGPYLLNLQASAFLADAAPSRPVIFKIIET